MLLPSAIQRSEDFVGIAMPIGAALGAALLLLAAARTALPAGGQGQREGGGAGYEGEGALLRMRM
jgi:hypothetical protein